MTDPNIKSQKPISSEEVRQNFRSEKRERYVGLKLMVGIAVVALMFLAYRLFLMPPARGKGADDGTLVNIADTISQTRVSNPGTPDTSTIPVANNSNPPIGSPQVTSGLKTPTKPQQLYLSISGNNLSDLREKLKGASEKILSQSNLKPVNASLNINSLSFRCDFEEVNPLERVKLLSLLCGPLPVGCESCMNALNQNPGSEILVRKTDNTFDYNVIAIR